MDIRHCFLTALLSLSSLGMNSLAAEPFTAENLVTLKRVGSPALAPNEQLLAYHLRSTDLKNDKGLYDIYLLDLTQAKAKPLQITKDRAADTSPKWSADGKSLYFLSSRSGSNQLWRYQLADKSISQATDFPVDISSYKLSNDGKTLVFSASVQPDCADLTCSAKKTKKLSEQKATGKLYNKMFVRHWDHWLDGTISRLFSSQLSSNSVTKAIPLTASIKGNVPSSPFGGEEEYTISPDGKNVIFSLRIADAKEPTSTNFDLYQVAIGGGEIINLTHDNPAWDTQPVFSSDGKQLAWLAMERAGFEADSLKVKIRDLASGKTETATKDWDRSFSSLAFSQDGKQLFLNGNHLGKKALWSFDLANKKSKLLTNKGYIGAFVLGKEQLIYQYDDLKNPADFYQLDLKTSNSQRLTNVNKKALKAVDFGDYEQFSFKGWNDEKVHGYLVKPADFDPKKKYPLAFLIHGGPQGSFGDHFHYRWNPQTYTGQGFVAVMIDFHGSTGYGQEFTDSISGDWGGKPLVDLQKGLAFVKDKYQFVDSDNACALGASYGGYMINWIAGNWSEQFKCLVNHDGIFDNRMMYFATEELWFVEWENGGTYFDQPQNYEKHNPVHHVKNWKTPMLVVQGTKDFRVPETQSLATFTALQRQNIPSKLLVFENENHWVLKPNNSIQWHQTVNQWLQQWLTPTKP